MTNDIQAERKRRVAIIIQLIMNVYEDIKDRHLTEAELDNAASRLSDGITQVLANEWASGALTGVQFYKETLQERLYNEDDESKWSGI